MFSALKRTALHVLVLALCTSIAAPAHLWARPSVGEIINSSTAELPTDLEARQDARDRLLGRTPKDTLLDPYYVSGQVVTVDERGTQKVYPLDAINPDFDLPSRTYDLKKDISVEVYSDRIDLVMKTIQGEAIKNNRIYRQTFKIPGVVQVLQNQSFVYLLLKNGDFLMLAMADQLLYHANEYAGGSALIAPLIEVAPPDHYQPSGELVSNARVEFFDIRNLGQYQFKPEVTAEAIKALRFGDVIFYREEGGQKRVDHILTLRGQAEGLDAHLKLLQARQKIIAETDAKGIEDMLGGMAASMQIGNHPLIRKTFGANPIDAAIAADSSQTLADVLRRRMDDWSRNPLENRGFKSDHLSRLAGVVSAAKALSQDHRNRSEVPLDEVKEMPEGSLERQTSDLLAELAKRDPAKPPTPLRKLIQGTKITLRGVAKAGLLGALGVAATAGYQFATGNAGDHTVLEVVNQSVNVFLNQTLRLLPTTLTDWHYSLPLWKIGSFEGPMVNYILKTIGVCAIFGAIPMALPKLALPLANRVMGKPMPKVTESGWHTYFTMALRASARMTISLRSLASMAGDAILEKVTGGRNLNLVERLEGARLGIDPIAMQRHTQLGQTTSQVQNETESKRGLARWIALKILLRKLVELGVLNQDDNLSKTVLEEKLGPVGYKNFESHFIAVSGYIETRLSPDDAKDETRYDAICAQFSSRDSVKDLTESPHLAPNEMVLKEAARVTTTDAIALQLPKTAGSNTTYLKFRTADSPPDVTMNVSQPNMYVDTITHAPLTALLVPDYGSVDNPNFQLAGNFGLGFMGGMHAMDWTLNFLSFSSNGPMDIMNWEKARAANLAWTLSAPSRRDADPANPALTSTAEQILLANPATRATYDESRSAYRRAFTGPDFWKAFSSLGQRITVAQLKNWKTVLYLGAFTTVIGFLMKWAADPSKGQWILQHLGSVTVFKVLICSAWAYLCYRIFWQLHGVGMGFVRGETRQNLKALARLSTDLAGALVEYQSDKSPETEGRVRDQMLQIEAFYNQKGAQIPEAMQSEPNLEAKAEAYAQHCLMSVPTPVSANSIYEKFATARITAITTIIGMTGFARSWGWAENFSWWKLGLLLGGVYTFGKLSSALGERGRADEYIRTVKDVEDTLAQIRAESDGSTALSPELKDRAFEVLMRVKALYVHYDQAPGKTGVDFDRLTQESDLVAALTQVSASIGLKETAPTSPARLEKGISIMGRCASLLGKVKAVKDKVLNAVIPNVLKLSTVPNRGK